MKFKYFFLFLTQRTYIDFNFISKLGFRFCWSNVMWCNCYCNYSSYQLYCKTGKRYISWRQIELIISWICNYSILFITLLLLSLVSQSIGNIISINGCKWTFRYIVIRIFCLFDYSYSSISRICIVNSPSFVALFGSLIKLCWLFLSSLLACRWRRITFLKRLSSLSRCPGSFGNLFWACASLKLRLDALPIFSSAWIIMDPARSPDWVKNVEFFLLWSSTVMSYSYVFWSPKSFLQNVETSVNREETIRRTP